jgi:hypothetical protein
MLSKMISKELKDNENELLINEENKELIIDTNF